MVQVAVGWRRQFPGQLARKTDYKARVNAGLFIDVTWGGRQTRAPSQLLNYTDAHVLQSLYETLRPC